LTAVFTIYTLPALLVFSSLSKVNVGFPRSCRARNGFVVSQCGYCGIARRGRAITSMT
jgi:hypothetical protein